MAYQLWTDPYPAPGPAFEQARFQLHAAPIAGVLDSIMRQREQQQQQIQQTSQQALKGLADYMNQKRTDDIAQTLLDQASDTDPLAQQLNDSPARPSQAWQAYTQLRQQNLKNDLLVQQAARQHALAQKAMTSPGGDSSPENIIYDPSGNPMKTTGHDAYQYWYGSGGNQSNDPWANAIPVARGTLDKDGAFTNKYTGAEQGDQVKLQFPNGKTTVVPWSNYEGHAGPPFTPPTTQQPPVAPNGPPQLPTNPSAPSPGLMPTQNGPPVGTQRNVGGKTYQWDGMGWVAM